jgi:hypothetical protein
MYVTLNANALVDDLWAYHAPEAEGKTEDLQLPLTPFAPKRLKKKKRPPPKQRRKPL